MAKRRPGRPHHHERPITPDKIELISAWYLEGVSAEVIASRLLVAADTIRHHIAVSIRPAWRERMGDRAVEELAKLDRIESLCWQRFYESLKPKTRKYIKEEIDAETKDGIVWKKVEKKLQRLKSNGSAVWFNVILDCMDRRAKLLGLYIERHIIESDFRVAGRTAEAVDEEMFARVADLLRARRNPKLN